VAPEPSAAGHFVAVAVKLEYRLGAGRRGFLVEHDAVAALAGRRWRDGRSALRHNVFERLAPREAIEISGHHAPAPLKMVKLLPHQPIDVSDCRGVEEGEIAHPHREP
jgi:hypothetical protein